MISIQNGVGEAKKAKKKISSWIPFLLDPCKEILKKKKLKNSRN